MRARRPWTIRISHAADADVSNILAWTAERYGRRQARTYASTLTSAIAALTDGPTVAGVRARDDVVRGLLTLHVARGRRLGRHIIVFRARELGTERVIEILRVLHDVMDLLRHVHARDENE